MKKPAKAKVKPKPLKMVTVVECINGVVYVYNHSTKHHLTCKFSGERITANELAHECNVSDNGRNWHVVIDGPIRQEEKQ